MNLGISELSILPVRKDPSHLTEMTTQILFGEKFKILDKIKEWAYVELLFDGYYGWVEISSIKEMNKEEQEVLTDTEPVILPLLNSVRRKEFHQISGINLMPGSEIHGMIDEGKNFSLFGVDYELDHPIQRKSGNKPDDIIETSSTYLNSTYLWGGKSPYGTDCSGFVQMVYKVNGISLPRDAGQQLKKGIPLNFIDEAQPGDLAFFDDDQGRIDHVGILLKGKKIIHASGIVRIDRIDHQGIYREETDQYTHKLRVVKRIL